jgi:hypothetical protein
MRGHLAPRERLKAGEPIGTTERNKRPVTETLGVWPADPLAVAWKPAGCPGCTVKPFARVDAVRDEFLARGPRCRRRPKAGPEPNRARPM